MTRRVNETVYRIRYMRKGWDAPKSAVFLSRHSAERRLEELREAWHGAGGPNPLVWTQLEWARVAWDGEDMDKRPYAYHPPVKQRKGNPAALKRKTKRTCQHCGKVVVPTGDAWKTEAGTFCPANKGALPFHVPA